MEESVSRLLTEELIQKALSLFAATEQEPKKLGDFENYAFEVYRNGIPFVLRLTHSSHRSKNQIESELDWLNFLSNQKVNVCRALPSINGNYVEELVSEDTFFFACLFKKANGKNVRTEDFNDTLFYQWGKLVGEMNHATKNYQKPVHITKRPEWDEEDLNLIEKFVQSDDKEVIEKGKALLQQIQELEKNPDSYGLIHSDVHSGNFFVENGKIEVFDFDDCSYHWFASDIAIPIYYAVWFKMAFDSKEERSEFAQNFARQFLKGYYEENYLDPYWIKQLPLFFKLRDLTLYSVFHKKEDLSKASERLLKLVSDIKNRILLDEAIADLDFELIIKEIEKVKK
ncbi:phosphotransferase enzyme family protein [Neobacillus sp. NPDC093127]|uniref:phosphotransferase enzyme family protein n=1 Tax=Neobacillus sp. NPDC093127 TaxID=3364296 RepID=UPI00382CE90F